MAQLEITMGALGPRLSEQLASQGHEMPLSEVEHYQRDIDAVSRLLLRDYLTDREAHRARKRLFNRIAARLQHLTKEKA